MMTGTAAFSEIEVRGAKAPRPVVHVSTVTTPSRPEHETMLVACLDSLFATTRDAPFDLKVTVVDNAPGNGIGQRIKARFPQVDILTNATRRGFAANHNSALAGSSADFYLVANDDLVFLPGSLARAVAYMNDPANARVGVVGFNLRNSDGSLQPSTYSFPTVPRALLYQAGLRGLFPHAGWAQRLARFVGVSGGKSSLWKHDRTTAVDTFFGALVLVCGAAARQVGLMDEVSLIGGEESDWNQRFRNAGWSTVFVHDAPVIHHGGQTVGGNESLRPEYLKGTLNFFWKHRSRAAFYSFAWATALLLAIRAGGYALIGNVAMARSMARSARVALTWRGK